MSIYDKLKRLNITLPPLTAPAAAYAPFVKHGTLIFVSGHIAKREGRPWVGQLGADLNTAEGRQAARGVAIDLIGTLHAAAGDLNNIKPDREAYGSREQRAYIYRAASCR